MGILRPVTRSHVGISLSSDDGELYYKDAFMSASEIKVWMEDGVAVYEPIVVESVFDPEHYKDLLNRCIESISSKGPGKPFSLEILVRNTDGRNLAQYRATGCTLVGISLPRFDRESGEVATFNLTLQPSGVSRILT